MRFDGVLGVFEGDFFAGEFDVFGGGEVGVDGAEPFFAAGRRLPRTSYALPQITFPSITVIAILLLIGAAFNLVYLAGKKTRV